jgi:hypothetical protein
VTGPVRARPRYGASPTLLPVGTATASHVNTLYIIAVMTSFGCGIYVLCLWVGSTHRLTPPWTMNPQHRIAVEVALVKRNNQDKAVGEATSEGVGFRSCAPLAFSSSRY